MGDITRLLQQIQLGDPSASEQLLTLLHDEIRQIARRYLAREGRAHSLQTGDLVNEVYLKLLGGKAPALRDRHHFFAAFARALRHVLVDHARNRATAKRGSRPERISLSGLPEVKTAAGGGEVDVLALNQALERLATLSPRQAEIVELRFFVGQSISEVAEVLGVGVSTVNREWALARAWLQVQLGG